MGPKVKNIADFRHFRSAQNFHLNMVSDSLGVAANQVDENDIENNDVNDNLKIDENDNLNIDEKI